MKKFLLHPMLLGLLLLSTLGTAADSLRRATDGVQQSVILFIRDNSEASAKLNHIFAANFDRYDQASVLSATDAKTLNEGINRFVADKVNAGTLVTVYYRGKAVSRSDNHLDLLTADGASVAVQEAVVQRILAKKPLGLFMFLDTDGVSAETLKPNWNGAAVFLPESADNRSHFAADFMNATKQNGMFINLSALSQRLNRSAVLFDRLNYQRFADYCLFPTPRGCHLNKLPSSYSAAASPQVGLKTHAVTLAGCAANIGEQTVGEAVSRLHIRSDCRSNQSVTVSYQQYDYTVNLDEQGQATTDIYLVAPEAEATLTFADGEKAKHLLSTNDLRRLDRVILSWRGTLQMDLHVLAFGAALNSDKDLWRETACSADTDNRKDGTLHCFRGSGDNAMNLQVYTRKRQSGNRRRGLIDFRVDFTSRGDTPIAPYCDSGTAASPSFFTRRIIAGRAERLKRYAWKAVACGTDLAPKVRYLRGTVNPITVR